ncbi:FAD binding domain protein [Desulfosarcina cetonica]|uniref:NAD(P)/FAD-dependent oxidoreductase n=1 Tax=Desulfosarcina cetonica TaxID=90730 RepID=UPI0006D0457D|nr:NAD(P)/FAD-dependent oxidoreductase [Desulfosarcina cetonica]VTR65693.1 FAD binding domain protein [Desulfosarcina cetonica]
MKNPLNADVIVVGAGPGGAASAKYCAAAGLKTVLIEKKALPRDKVCTGMIMGNWALDTIREEFGTIPDTIFTSPPELNGHRFYVAGAAVQTLTAHTLLTWRKDLDHWLVACARDAGAVLVSNTRVLRVVAHEDHIRVDLLKDGKKESLSARFVIGADGATSVVRKSILPELQVNYSGPVRVWYQGRLSLDQRYIHWFFPKRLPRPRFNVNHKDGILLLEGAGIKELAREIAETLSPYGFDPDWKPIKKDGCVIALLHRQLLEGDFVPAKGNVLLVGDAAGLILPITFEGIGTALKSGIAAARTIIANAHHGRIAAPEYVSGIQTIIDAIRHLYMDRFHLKGEMDPLKRNLGPDAIAAGLVSAYRETLLLQE